MVPGIEARRATREGSPILLETYLLQRGALKRLLKARLRSEEEAEDLLQELFIRLRRGNLACEVQNPTAYLFRMALNLARDHQRERRRAEERDGQWVESVRMTLGTEPIADVPSAEAAYEAKQHLAAVVSALQELSPHARRVFVLHRFEGLTHLQIAERLGISRSTVEKHMTTALKYLVARFGRG